MIKGILILNLSFIIKKKEESNVYWFGDLFTFKLNISV